MGKLYFFIVLKANYSSFIILATEQRQIHKKAMQKKVSEVHIKRCNVNEEGLRNTECLMSSIKLKPAHVSCFEIFYGH